MKRITYRARKPPPVACVWCFALGLAFVAGTSRGQPPSVGSPGLLFHGSFDVKDINAVKTVIGSIEQGVEGEFPSADFAVGNPAPLRLNNVVPTEDGKFGTAAKIRSWATKDGKTIRTVGSLKFDAMANIHARRGTVAFWVRPDGSMWSARYRSGSHPRLFLVEDQQWPLFFRRSLLDLAVHHNKSLILRSGDQTHRLDQWTWAAGDQAFPDNEWQHVAIVWDAAQGMILYHNGVPVLDQWGRRQDFRFPVSDWFELGHQGGGGLDLSFDELYIFDYALSPQQLTTLMEDNRPPAHPPLDGTETSLVESKYQNRKLNLPDRNIPRWEGGKVVARKIGIREVRDVKMTMRFAVDGKAHTIWPTPYKGYRNSGKALNIAFAEPSRIDFIRLQGDYSGELTADGEIMRTFSGDGLIQRWLGSSRKATKVDLIHQSGSIGNLEFFTLEDTDEINPRFERWTYTFPDFGSGAEANPFNLPIAHLYPKSIRQTLVAGKPGSQAGTLHAGEICHLVVPPAATNRLVGEILLSLPLDASALGANIHLTMIDTLLRVRETFGFELKIGKAPSPDQPVELRIILDENYPLAAGQPLWLRIQADRDLRLYKNRGPLKLELAQDPAALANPHLAALERDLCDVMMIHSEPRPWHSHKPATPQDNRSMFKATDEIMTLAEQILKFQPDNYTAASVYSWLVGYRRKWPAEIAARYSDPLAGVRINIDAQSKAPYWAQLGREALRVFRQHPDWWIAERQTEWGEFGANLNDDTDLVPDWVNFALIGDPEERYRESLRKLAAIVWDRLLTEGWSSRLTDWLHATEEGTNITPLLLLLDYGEPRYVEQMIITGRLYDTHLTVVNAQGDRFVRSQYWSATEVDENWPGYRGDTGNATMFKAGRYLTEYNRNPRVLRTLREWADTWMRLADSSQKEIFGRFARDPHTGEAISESFSGAQITLHLEWLCRMLDDHEPYRKLLDELESRRKAETSHRSRPTASMPPGFHDGPGVDGTAEMAAGMTDAGMAQPDRVERQRLLENLANETLHMLKYLPLHTWVGQSTDRVAVPQMSLAKMYLGGSASRAKRQGLPFHAVSWEGASDEVVRYVTRSGQDNLNVLLYNFSDQAEAMTLRVWRLAHGRYQVRAGLDNSGDEQIDVIQSDRETDLYRHAGLDFTVPPGGPFIIDIAQLDKYDERIEDRCDIAMGRESIRIKGGELWVRVHSLGSRAVPASTLRIIVDTDAAIDVPIPPLDSTADLSLVRHDVRIPLPARPSRIEAILDSENRIPEITKVNNRRVWTARNERSFRD